jgi:hypothetical protein
MALNEGRARAVEQESGILHPAEKPQIAKAIIAIFVAFAALCLLASLLRPRLPQTIIGASASVSAVASSGAAASSAAVVNRRPASLAGATRTTSQSISPTGARPRAFDASEGTPLDPLLNQTYDLTHAKAVPFIARRRDSAP